MGGKDDLLGIMHEILIWPYAQMVYSQSEIHPEKWDAQTSRGFWDTNGSPNLGQTTKSHDCQQKVSLGSIALVRKSFLEEENTEYKLGLFGLKIDLMSHVVHSIWVQWIYTCKILAYTVIITIKMRILIRAVLYITRMRKQTCRIHKILEMFKSSSNMLDRLLWILSDD